MMSDQQITSSGVIVPFPRLRPAPSAEAKSAHHARAHRGVRWAEVARSHGFAR